MRGKSDLSSLFLRLALAASFLSAVADRFGIWGAYGNAHVAWGNFARFINYTHVLTSAFPMPVAAAAIFLSCQPPDRFTFDARRLRSFRNAE